MCGADTLEGGPAVQCSTRKDDQFHQKFAPFIRERRYLANALGARFSGASSDAEIGLETSCRCGEIRGVRPSALFRRDLDEQFGPK